MKKDLKCKKGITLVALVITIIILLLLAGITIAQLTGNGLFKKTLKAEEESNLAQILEHIKLIVYEKNIEKQGKATLEDIVDGLDSDKNYEYEILFTNESKAIKIGELKENSEYKEKIKNAKSIIVICKNFKINVTSDLNVAALDVERVIDTSDRESYKSDVFSKIKCNLELINSRIKVTIMPEFQENKNENDVFLYVISVNGKAIGYTKELTYIIDEKLTSNTKYDVTVYGIDNSVTLAKSDVFSITTPNYVYVKKVLEYPVLTDTGVKNVKYEEQFDSSIFYYDFDSNVQPTADLAAKKEAYDGNANTFDSIDGSKRFIYILIDESAIGKTIEIDSDSPKSGGWIGLSNSIGTGRSALVSRVTSKTVSATITGDMVGKWLTLGNYSSSGNLQVYYYDIRVK